MANFKLDVPFVSQQDTDLKKTQRLRCTCSLILLKAYSKSFRGFSVNKFYDQFSLDLDVGLTLDPIKSVLGDNSLTPN